MMNELINMVEEIVAYRQANKKANEELFYYIELMKELQIPVIL